MTSPTSQASNQRDDEAAQHFLLALRDGTPEKKVVARAGLASIFARRGMYEEAVELYELNVRDGARSPELFEQLGDAYRHLGDEASASAALAEARRMRSTVPPQAPAQSPTVSPSVADGHHPSVPEGHQNGVAHGDGSLAPPASSTSAAPTAATARLTALPPSAPLAADQTPASDVTARLRLVSPDALASAGDADGLTDADAPVGRAGGAVPGPLLAIAGFLFLIVLPVVMLALLVVNPLALYLEGRSAGPTIDAQAGELPTLKIAPSATSAWYVQAGRSVSGLWATPGLDLTLDRELAGSGRAFTVTAPRAQSWGETITIVERRGQGRANQTTVVAAAFGAPASLPAAGTVLNGHIAGQVIAPRLSDTGQFDTVSESIDVPVHLLVVSLPELWLDRFVNAFGMFFDEDRWLLVTIGALLAWCVVAGGAALLFRPSRP
ncbi:MAG: hypothetical protein U0893_09315 [Chloroflexota bacterium]